MSYDITLKELDDLRHYVDNELEQKIDKTEFRWIVGIMVSASIVAIGFQWNVLTRIENQVQSVSNKTQEVAEDVSGIRGELRQLELIPD